MFAATQALDDTKMRGFSNRVRLLSCSAVGMWKTIDDGPDRKPHRCEIATNRITTETLNAGEAEALRDYLSGDQVMDIGTAA